MLRHMHLSQVETRSRENNLTIIRLLAATAVTFGHSYPLVHGEHQSIQPWLDSAAFGFYAVAIFFGLSGFLISQSYLRRPTWVAYLEARWLRIFPGLFFANLVTAFLVSQLVLEQGWSAFADIKNWRYTFGAFFFDSPYFNGVFANNPLPATNGSLWTLPLEFRMYLFVLVIGALGILRRPYLALGIAVMFIAAVIGQIDFIVLKVFKILFAIKTYNPTYLALPYCFGLGLLALLFARRIPLSVPATALLLFAAFFVDHWIFRATIFVYAALVIGYHPRLYIRRLDFKFDLSYGIYVMSWPVQQTIMHFRAADTPLVLFVKTMAAVVPLAALSWYFVESPALRLKGRLAKKFARA